MLDEARLIAVIKKAAADAVEATYPVRVVFGTVTGLSPLTVRIDQKLPLSGDALLPVSGIRRLEPALSAGDAVILLRMQGGQKYILLDRVVG